MLAGLEDDLLDRPPAPDEWPLRETLAHAIGVERSYRANTAHAVARAEDEPLSLPEDRRPQPDPSDTSGGILDILSRFAARRAETDAAFAGLTEADLARPALWVRHEVDVRFRLHRFGSHLAEHAIQCAKTVSSLGAGGGDARAIARRIGTLRGLHERRSPPESLRALDVALAATVEALGA